eukprot:CAMPEP_0113540438 /NCGR_PEP_ID=MMETSP0015_2-20120614/8480_1 /TAXON_ID=2838 /ORGANISM="Odontella" /LENGTH=164 /DNA_ID=CAMNT_0000440241 /DNA_START=477 /DNA_END=972 /DNA_ORIENTATION=- /assembly_acc=CAM_ASM_000160
MKQAGGVGPDGKIPQHQQHQQHQQQQQWQQEEVVVDDTYNEMLHKLAVSMKRSEASRASVLRQRQLPFHPQQQQTTNPRTTVPCAPRTTEPVSSPATIHPTTATARTATTNNNNNGTFVPHLQSVVSLSGFFNGQRTTLTSGLEQSRRQLQAFGRSQMTRVGSI